MNWMLISQSQEFSNINCSSYQERNTSCLKYRSFHRNAVRSIKTRQIISQLMIKISMIKFETFTLYTLVLDGSWHKFVTIAVLSVYVSAIHSHKIPGKSQMIYVTCVIEDVTAGWASNAGTLGLWRGLRELEIDQERYGCCRYGDYFLP